MIAALYARVSTSRQAEKELSIPDQLRQMREWCKARNYSIAIEYVEPGASATDDRRPVFQQMIGDACISPPPFDVIIVHSLSRFFRDAIEFGIYERRLKKHGVIVLSITQQTSDDPSGEMARRIFSLFDEYQSKENGKHTLRAMKENFRQGYHCGSTAPYGWRVEEVSVQGNKGKKKRLIKDDEEAEIIRKIFDLYVNGYNSEQFGIKSIAKHLNAQGVTMRCKPWKKTLLDKILSNTLYATGEYFFNKKEAKSRKLKPESEWVKVSCEPIIDIDTFNQAQQKRQEHSPQSASPSAINSPTLLTGFLKCGVCGAPMTLATGKGGRYRYYRCTTRINHGSAACTTNNLRMEMLDSSILEALSQGVFSVEQVSLMINKLKNGSVISSSGNKEQITKLSRELEEVQRKVNKLYDAVERGFLPMDGTLRERLEGHQKRKQFILSEMATLRQQQDLPLSKITPEHIKKFCSALHEKLLNKDSTFGKEYLKLLLKEITITGNEVRIKGKYAGVIQALQKKRLGNPLVGAQPLNVWLPSADSNHGHGG